MYERAIGNVPLPLDAPEKRFWQRYIYLWLNYAIWEEMEAEDPARTREVYRNCLKLIPHQVFTFAKVCPQRHRQSMYHRDYSHVRALMRL